MASTSGTFRSSAKFLYSIVAVGVVCAILNVVNSDHTTPFKETNEVSALVDSPHQQLPDGLRTLSRRPAISIEPMKARQVDRNTDGEDNTGNQRRKPQEATIPTPKDLSTTPVETNTTTPMLDGFPVTRFTPTVLEILKDFTHETVEKCPKYFTMVVPKPFSYPTIGKENGGAWIQILNHTFDRQQYPNRILPGNVSLGFSIHDGDTHGHPQQNRGCLASSTQNGTFSFINFLEAKRLASRQEFIPIPWEKRKSIPVFRGTSHGPMNPLHTKNESEILDFVLSRCLRCRAVYLSKQHPELLDAKFHAPKGELFSKKLYKNIIAQSKTNGLHNLLPFDPIPEKLYYTKYQCALVLCGIGAAFRTAIHLSTETAVVLDDCKFQEWFIRYMIPWKHYIPVDRELSNLEERMIWIQNNPEEVRKIAQNGKQFYLDYLSFDRNEEHLYELLYRLALQVSSSSKNKK